MCFRGVFVRNIKSLLFIGVCFFSLLALPAQAGKALDRLNAFFADTGAMRAKFTQTVEGGAFSQPKLSTGTLMMQRPGRFRWDYKTPYKQLILADGKRLWIYDPDLMQVVVKPLEVALGDTPALLLSSEGLGGSRSLQERFVITELNHAREGLYWVQLLPRDKNASFQELQLGFGKRYLRRMILVDGFGQKTTLVFSDIEVNAKVKAGSFQFKPPKGVDVIGNPEAESGKRQ
jgi:outer membrane lipoprotein carrier protein